MATIYKSIGERADISISDGDSSLPSSSTGSGTFASPYSMTYGSSPGNIGIGDVLEVMDGSSFATFYYYVKSVSGNTVEVVFVYEDSGMSMGSSSPVDLFDMMFQQAGHDYSRGYSSMAAWETGLSSSNWYSSGDDVVGWIHDDNDYFEENVIFNNTTNFNSVKLTVPESDRHDGTANTGVINKPNADPGANNSTSIFNIDMSNFTLEWIEIDMSGSTSTNICLQTSTNNTNADKDITIQNMIVHTWGTNQTTDPQHGILLRGASGGYHKIYNNIFYNFDETDDSNVFINCNQSRATVYVYNNTGFDIQVTSGSKTAYGILFSSNNPSEVNIVNNIMLDVNNTGGSKQYDFYRGTSNRSGTRSHNLSSDSTASTYGTDAQTGQTASDVCVSTTGSIDLHILDTSDAVGNGTDLGTEANVDINGFDRNGTDVDWDIGAHQVTTGGGTTAGAAFLLFVD